MSAAVLKLLMKVMCFLIDIVHVLGWFDVNIDHIQFHIVIVIFQVFMSRYRWRPLFSPFAEFGLPRKAIVIILLFLIISVIVVQAIIEVVLVTFAVIIFLCNISFLVRILQGVPKTITVVFCKVNTTSENIGRKQKSCMAVYITTNGAVRKGGIL